MTHVKASIYVLLSSLLEVAMKIHYLSTYILSIVICICSFEIYLQRLYIGRLLLRFQQLSRLYFNRTQVYLGSDL